ncbi:hypothetical protein JX266_007846 [Neoarthrinium moseri]|nr:hypothetical protein JX266_007846 [Neoarthrinium moseri]
MEDPSTKLVDELCSLLDEATILSICSDYDLTEPDEFQAAREILLSISKDVEAEEATGFNPSGLGANKVVDINGAGADEPGETRNVSESDLKSNDGFTSATESSAPQSVLSTGSSKTSTQDAPEPIHLGLFDGLSNHEKEIRLGEMFTLLKPIDVKLALQKAKGDADLALDVLLNTEHLEQMGQRLKGVDGFYVADDAVQAKKRKGKKKKGFGRISESANSSSTNVSVDSKANDETHQQNIAFLADRLPLQESDVATIYYQHDSSMGATVVQFLDNYMMALGIEPTQTCRSRDADDLAKEFSWIPTKYITPILEITAPTRQHALDIIHILADYYEKPAYLKYDVSYRVAAPRLDIETPENSSSNTRGGKSWSALAKAGPPSLNQTLSPQSPVLSSSDFAALRDQSYNYAGATFKKGGLYRQAAVVYSERGRELAQSHRQATSAEAAYMVDRTSTHNKIDLHGITVQDGVDIALERVRRWWESLGEDRARKAKDGFTIVTGLGRHSADGKSRLRINVCKALVADGWKVEVLTGQYLVTGRRR